MTTEANGPAPTLRLKYVNRDHSHPLYHATGVMVVRSHGRGGPKSELVRLDDGRLVVAPYGNWRKA